ncbi:helix-turn-helix domain-containing protein [Kordia sp.]|uniref:helix-turn-helix domain-containing protein n=1 Tax=Kordia sp. TaxID=1965332 RepID=UPI003D2717E1
MLAFSIKWHIVSIFFLFSIATIQGQNNSQKDFSNLSFTRLDSLFQHKKQHNFDEAKTYANEMLKKAYNDNNSTWKIASYYNLAFIHRKLGDNEHAINAIDSLRNYATEMNDAVFLAKSYFLEGNIFYQKGNYKETLSLYLKSWDISKNTEDKRSSLITLYNIALLRKDLANYKEALADGIIALKGFKEIGDHKSEISVLHFLSNAYLSMDSLDVADHYINLGVEKSIYHKDEEAYFLLVSEQGKLYHKQKKYQKALEKFKEAKTYFDRNSIIRRRVLINLYIARTYHEIEDYSKVIEVLKPATNLLDTHEISFTEIPDLYFLLANSYLHTKEIEKARIYYEKHTNAQKLIYKQNNQLLTKIHKEYDIKKFEDKIKKLTDKSKSTQNTILLISSLLLCILGFFLVQYYRKNKKNEKALSKILEQLETKNIQKNDQEKMKIAAIEDKNIQRILQSLETLETTGYYLTLNCTLAHVAKEINTNTSYLSKIINQYKEKSFTNYINEYRINTALEKLKNDAHYQRYTIEYLAQEFGFSRSETFTRVFKKQTGISPAYYLRKLKNDNS